MTPVDILVFGAHPDDAEIGMGGTIAKAAKAGRRIAICDLTQAELSSNGTVELRQQEAAEASQVLQLAERSNLKLPDRGLYMTKDIIDAVTREIRRLRPSIVFAPYWQDRHPDHVACSSIVDQAVFNAKLRNYMPEHEPVTVSWCYYYFINDTYEPNSAVDVSEVYELKTAALSAYRSQFEKLDSSYVDTPLNQAYVSRVEARDHLMGQKIGVRYAEGFVSKLPLKIDVF
ncbi:bacillithiol biosynthesis deacetylase BshB1 [Paenibacillus turpanensis]|uniref:bacillithiol biosynthesis deacetylase BshB1 n=1 Tax=Paenibacillus turpanensis TaxID=2689078 RepID=UPI0014092B59|nr:bacillithiol biosynthesis deacetylase BshB1 [Paenibacillus turpanensis]